MRILLALHILLLLAAPAWAQEVEEAPPAAEQGAEVAVEQTPTPPAEINPNTIPSLFFTYWEQAAILDAKRARGDARAPTDAELRAGLPADENYKPPPEARELRLGGIVFRSADDWTIWLNEKRVTPEALPADAIELRVGKEYIDIKWFDTYTNQIFPVRLRPHQRFNLDTRIFLPG